MARLPAEAPPLAASSRSRGRRCRRPGSARFRILESAHGGEPDAPVDRRRRHLRRLPGRAPRPRPTAAIRYPFVNCTDCGPRFTIVRGVPYDRPLTTMAGFAMCPRVPGRVRRPGRPPLPRAAQRVPGLRADRAPGRGDRRRRDAPGRGGAARRRDRRRQGPGRLPPRVPRRRRGGGRAAARAQAPRGPAVRAHGAPTSRRRGRWSSWGRPRRGCWPGRERPIVLAPRRADAPVAAAVAPRSAELGVMLPYSPLHHLLAHDTATTLVMTSGNVSDEPIAYRDDDARERLAGIADHVLLHDRPIHTRTDDSVVRAVGGRPLMLRRSRGHVPGALALPLAAPGLLACGAELKSTFCVAKGARAWVGHHIGDLRNEETLRSFTEGVAHFERLFAVTPEVVAHDLHPDYLSTTYALAREGVEHVGVQHHHAHLAAVLAEHGERGPAIGAIYDGTGYGPDGDGVGRRAAGRRPRRLRARRPSVARAPARRRPRRAPAVADGLRVAGRGPGRRALAAARDRAAHLARGGRARAHGAGRAADDEHGPALRRRRGALRPAHRGHLRGPGGGRARGDQRSLRARRLSARRRRAASSTPAGRSPPSRCRWRPASTRR